MKPIIGIASDLDEKKFYLNLPYVKAVKNAGGLPVLVPPLTEADIEQWSELLDGYLLSGGCDVNPLLFGEEPHQELGKVKPERDAIEIDLTVEMLRRDKPVLGICRGMQVLGVAVGGTLYQDIYSQHITRLLKHIQKAPRDHATHSVQIEVGSKLFSITGLEELKVNSFHHQAIKEIPSPFIVSARSKDGIAEAIESRMHRFAMGVQWHPEELGLADDLPSQQLFEVFIDECKKQHQH